MSALPPKAAWLSATGMSAMCQKRTLLETYPKDSAPTATIMRAAEFPFSERLHAAGGSFVKAEHLLDSIRDGRFAVLVAIFRNFLDILYHCVGFDDRVVAFAVVVTA